MKSLPEIINACGLIVASVITAYGAIKSAKILQDAQQTSYKKKNKHK